MQNIRTPEHQKVYSVDLRSRGTAACIKMLQMIYLLTNLSFLYFVLVMARAEKKAQLSEDEASRYLGDFRKQILAYNIARRNVVDIGEENYQNISKQTLD